MGFKLRLIDICKTNFFTFYKYLWGIKKREFNADSKFVEMGLK
jgi:hypothetical protein